MHIIATNQSFYSYLLLNISLDRVLHTHSRGNVFTCLKGFWEIFDKNWIQNNILDVIYNDTRIEPSIGSWMVKPPKYSIGVLTGGANIVKQYSCQVVVLFEDIVTFLGPISYPFFWQYKTIYIASTRAIEVGHN